METESVEGVEELVENEWYIVRYSGEVPEIAYNSAIYFLTGAAGGPQLTLLDSYRECLLQAAVDRFEEIILRDLYHKNVGTSGYRGVARSLCNYDRFVQFCSRQDLDPQTIRTTAGKVYSTFLEVESRRLASEGQTTVINCSFAELKQYAMTLGTPFLDEYLLLEPHCPQNP